MARSDADIDGLFQLATFIVFSDRLWVNAFEPALIAERTEEIRARIGPTGAEAVIRLAPETDATYAAACRRAA
jgi:hypothetical protein